MEQKDSFTKHNILCILTACGGGDWPPLLALAKGLHQHGHELRIVCDGGTVKAVVAAGLPFMCVPAFLDLEKFLGPALVDMLEEGKRPGSGSDNPLIAWGQASSRFIQDSLQDWPPSMIITSLFGLGLGDILAREFSCFRCFLNPACHFCYSADLFRFSDYSEMGGLMYLNWLQPLADTADFVLVATNQKFDLDHCGLPDNHIYVGPLFWEQPGNVFPELSQPGPPWILVTMSSSPQPGDITLAKVAMRVLESMDVRVVVTLADGHDRAQLNPVPENAYLSGYCPHSQVLPKCCLVISHAGHGIVMKAMTYGVPMVLVPWGRDQPGVAERARLSGVAAVLSRKECSVDAMYETVRMVLKNSEYNIRAKEWSGILTKQSGIEEAVGSIERFLSG